MHRTRTGAVRLTQTVRTASEQETTQREKKNETKRNENPISRQRSRNGRVRDFADTERSQRNTKHIKDRHRYSQCYIAREKDEYKRSLKTKSITSTSMGIRVRWRGNAGTASWSDPGIGQPVRQHAYQELTYTFYGKAEKRKSTTSISAGLL